jgi:hypothetical protein
MSSINVSHNTFGTRPRDPDLTAVSIGNNLSVESVGKLAIKSLQINKYTDMSSSIAFNHNVGRIGPLNLKSQTIGNNLSITIPRP